MNTELIFRIGMAVTLTAYVVIRGYYARLAVQADKNFFRPRRDLRQTAFGLLFFSGIVLMVIYIVAPEQLMWAALLLPAGWRWLGVGLGLMVIFLLLWVHQALGKNLSAPGVMKEKQSLVIAGPYQWVRHPMYTVLFLFGIAYFLISANWLIGAVWIGWIVGTVASLIRDEEDALIEKFGDGYRSYMWRTGRFLPRVQGGTMNAKITSEEPKDRFTITDGVLRWILVNLVFLLALGLSLFLAAGRMDWRLGWIFLGVIAAGQTATTLMLLLINPTLLGERAWMQKGSKPWDKVIVSLGDAGWMLTGIIAGLDARFNWSPRLGVGFPIAGLVLIVLGYVVFLWAMASNRFFSSFVRIQADRGHTVETGGPYRYVRHPGYVGALFIYVSSPLALASLWTFVSAVLLLVLFVFRTALEDQTLKNELEGYADYARRVRYRLLPGVW